MPNLHHITRSVTHTLMRFERGKDCENALRGYRALAETDKYHIRNSRSRRLFCSFKDKQGPDLRYLLQVFLRGLIFRLATYVFIMANMSYLPNFRSLEPPHGLEEAPVVHQLGHGHHGEVGQFCHWLSYGQY